MPQLNDELRYKLLKALEANPNASQRELSKAIGVSLGKTNFCIKALLDVGWIKANNFRNSQNKLAYSYLLTPKGVEEKLAVTKRFLKAKVAEHIALEVEINEARRMLSESSTNTHLFVQGEL